MAMSFSNISKTVLFLSNNGVATSVKQTKIKQSFYSSHMKSLKLYSQFNSYRQQFLLAHQVRYLCSDIPQFIKYLVFYGIITALQIFVEEELKLPILLFVITQKCYCCCYSYLQLMALFTVTFIKKKMQLLRVFFSQSKLMSLFVPAFTFSKLIERCLRKS